MNIESENNTESKEELLLKAIFNEAEGLEPEDDNYPSTHIEKVGYAEFVLTNTLGNIGKAIQRLSRLHRLLIITDKSGNGLPDIITNNEIRMAIKPILHIENDVKDVLDMLIPIYKETKTETQTEGQK